MISTFPKSFPNCISISICLPTLRNTKQFGCEVENHRIFTENVEDWKEKYFSADATAEALKAELKLKQSNLDQVRENKMRGV